VVKPAAKAGTGEAYRIRRARSADAGALAAIEATAFADAGYAGMQLSRRSFTDHIRAGRNALFVAVQPSGKTEVVCGYALGFVKRTSPYVRFVSLAIRPEDAGKGAGTLLFRSIESFARKNGYRGVRLEIRDDNTRLFERYSRLGYRVFETVRDYYADGHAAIRMVRDVRPAG
jgi:ribosomal protein S18 acetylase RimI-like enzyme